MSVYLTADDSPGTQVASNAGWGDFVAWVDSLDADAHPALCHLVDHGWAEPAAEVAADLAAALAAARPDDTVVSTAATMANILAAFADDDPVVVTEGFSPAGPDDGQEGTGDSPDTFRG